MLETTFPETSWNGALIQYKTSGITVLGEAFIRKSTNETDTELTKIAEKNKEHAKRVKQNEVRKLSYGEALYQLCTIIGNTKKTQAALDALHRITGVTWNKTADGLWQSGNLKLDKQRRHCRDTR